MLNTRKAKSAVSLAVMLTVGLATPAIAAFADQMECDAAVAETTRQLLKADVSSEALIDIDELLVSAGIKCTNGDLEGAQSDVDAARKSIASSGQ